MSNIYEGQCLCEAVKYQVEGEFESLYLCHCSRCKRSTGTAFAANIFSSTARINWLAGKENKKNFTLGNTRHTKCFCNNCSSPLPYNLDGNMIVIPSGSLNTEIELKPTAHIFCDSKANWEKYIDESVEYAELVKN